MIGVLDDLVDKVSRVQILVAGSINRDLVVEIPEFPVDDGTVEVQSVYEGFGGHGANCAHAVARLGARAVLLGAVGADGPGADLIGDLEVHGVDVKGVHVDKTHATGLVIIPSAPERRFMLMRRAANDAPRDWSKALHEAGSEIDIALMMDPAPELASAILENNALNPKTKVVWAPGGLWVSRSEFRDMHRRADILILNRVEYVKALETCERIASTLVVTMGSEGSCIHDADGNRIHAPAYAVEAVDETGAGDAFVATYVVLLAIGGVSEVDRLRISNMAGALATTAVGARAGHVSMGTLLSSLGAVPIGKMTLGEHK